ncbi:trypsin-like peptidase domain-containing protein [Limobrevibacterium gyesilva]|uniref:Trypsin-like peptidase domain-containing protein n=1 Tax=Limobrevibacterium gyesilva TaxID=2991712 RepID=A0AA42CJE4_9PROT|nr:trypsin-like peptidase domain-containing protein [Limobrevibacterium gyesilva]MCW3476822.1 trypsin-like peptidase domain-containing protein [Limobrevibacterium gyesilva]
MRRPRFLTFLSAVAIVVMALAAMLPDAAASRDVGGYSDLAATLLPPVVNIATVKVVQMPKQAPAVQAGLTDTRRVRSLGSGVIIDPSGIIVTNRHVIEGAVRISVTLQDNTQYRARVLSRGGLTDLAVLKVEADFPLPTATFGNSDQVRIGDSVLAIGNPLGLGGSVSSGIVSALNRDIRSSMFDDFIQTDAAINPGNSGGPLFNNRGEVIGINTAIYTQGDASGSIGLGFAMPSNDVKWVVDRLLQFGEVRAGSIGVRMQQVTPELADALELRAARGGLVAGLDKDGPASKARIAEGDVILAYNGVAVQDIRQLARNIGMTEAGTTVPVLIWRNGRSISVSVTAGQLPGGPMEEAMQAAVGDGKPVAFELGLRLATVNDQARDTYKLAPDQAGVVVLDVAPAGAAADAGLNPGDVITRIAQTPVTVPAEVERLVDDARAQRRRYALFLVQGPDGARWVPVPLADQP